MTTDAFGGLSVINPSSIVIFLMVLGFEFGLLRINYIARAKAGFIEGNKAWRWFDKRGLMVATIPIHAAFVVGLSLWALLYNELALGFLAGAISFNYLADDMTWKRFQKAPSYLRCSKCNTQMPTHPAQCPHCDKLQ